MESSSCFPMSMMMPLSSDPRSIVFTVVVLLFGLGVGVVLRSIIVDPLMSMITMPSLSVMYWSVLDLAVVGACVVVGCGVVVVVVGCVVVVVVVGCGVVVVVVVGCGVVVVGGGGVVVVCNVVVDDVDWVVIVDWVVVELDPGVGSRVGICVVFIGCVVTVVVLDSDVSLDVDSVVDVEIDSEDDRGVVDDVELRPMMDVVVFSSTWAEVVSSTVSLKLGLNVVDVVSGYVVL